MLYESEHGETFREVRYAKKPRDYFGYIVKQGDYIIWPEIYEGKAIFIIGTVEQTIRDREIVAMTVEFGVPKHYYFDAGSFIKISKKDGRLRGELGSLQ